MFPAFLFLFGLAIGSFLNVLIDRWSQEQSIQGRSHCDYCHRQLGWYDLIPVVSFVSLGGKCRYCSKKLSWQYPLVEILTGGLFLITYYLPTGRQANYLYLWAYLGIVSCLIVIFFSDAKYHIIADQVQIGLLIFGLILLPYIGAGHASLPVIFFNRVVAAIVVMAPILFLHYVTRGKGMGFGDVKLAFVIGFLLGLQAGIIALYFAFIFGAVYGLVMLFMHRRGLKSKIAFGPFIVTGTFIMLFWGDKILAVLKRLYGF